jgi:methylmalonyl-CoA/ethylmalonyl-CoA epimerase
MIKFDEIARLASDATLPEGFLGKLFQVSLVTTDLRRAVEGMQRLGIGPWRTYRFDRQTCTDQTYMGKPGEFVFKNALADMPGLMWEIIQPLEGANIYSDFLAKHGEGLHHLLFDCSGRDWEEQNQAMRAAGHTCIQSAKWRGVVSFAYYTNDLDNGIIIEIMNIGPGWTRPVPEEVYE